MRGRMAAAWKFLQIFFNAFHKKIYASSMQHTKFLENRFRNSIQQTLFFESQETFWWFQETVLWNIQKIETV